MTTALQPSSASPAPSPAPRRARASKAAVAAAVAGLQSAGLTVGRISITGSTIDLYPATDQDSGSPPQPEHPGLKQW